jgi:ArsR family transcriptional regulator
MANSRFPDLPPHVHNDLLQLFKLLSDQTRFRILVDLGRHGEFSVMELCDRLGQSQPAISHHLGLLRLTGIVQMRRDGKSHYYSVKKERFSKIIHQIMECIEGDEKAIQFEGFQLARIR